MDAETLVVFKKGWPLEGGNPRIIVQFADLDSLAQRNETKRGEKPPVQPKQSIFLLRCSIVGRVSPCKANRPAAFGSRGRSLQLLADGNTIAQRDQDGVEVF
jgi:hypothetical protein